MIKLEMKLEGDIHLDKFEVEIDCPGCGFTNPIWLKQARLRDVIICRERKGQALHSRLEPGAATQSELDALPA
jgi:hypothetical protein